MPGTGTAVRAGDRLAKQVVALAGDLQLESREQYRCGRRLWGAERYIDVVLTDPISKRRLGIECKAQDSPGTAEEKVVATIQDIDAWPITGLVVFSGEGFSDKMRSFMIASGKAVDFAELEEWLRLFFGLELPAAIAKKKKKRSKAWSPVL
ncbi:MAG: hypothetical protein K2X93_11925 [Candidatus Obscuribacterales bacterium]|nr:hypothetical protein [Candidatus Obscuribacterales bacterium]